MRPLRLSLVALVLLALGGAPAATPDGTFNVRSFGAAGDGIADDTAAIQAAIDASAGDGDPARVGRLAKGPVHLPPGTYRVTRPLRVYSVSYLKFSGAGKSTRIKPSGTLASVLDLNGVAFSSFEDFLIEGDTTEQVQDAIAFTWDPTLANRSSSGCVFRNLTIQSTRFATGFRIGKWGSADQVDTSSYDNVTINGYWTPAEKTWYQNAFLVGSGVYGNNLIHSFWHCSAVRCAIGFHVAATNFMLCGGSLGANGVDFQADTLSYFLVQGIRSENSGRLLVAGNGPTTNAANVSLTDLVWEAGGLAPDGAVVNWNGSNGTLALRNIYFGPGKGLHVAMAPWLGATLVLDGVTATADVEGFLAGCTARVDAVVSGMTTLKADGTGWGSSSRGVVTSGPVRFRGSGNLIGQPNGQLIWAPDHGKQTVLAKP